MGSTDSLCCPVDSTPDIFEYTRESILSLVTFPHEISVGVLLDRSNL